MKDRKEYRAKAHRAINELFDKVDKLEEQVKRTGSEGKQRFNERVNDLRKQREELRNKYQKLEQASGDSWDEVKRGFEEARDALGKAWERARAEFKDETVAQREP